MKATFILATMAIFTATMANPAPSPLGIEVFEQDGQTLVREVVSLLNDIGQFWSSDG